MRDDETPAPFSRKNETQFHGLSITLAIPAEGELGPALMRRVKKMQNAESMFARSERRNPRTITVQEVILRHCCQAEGVKFFLPQHELQ